MASTERIIDIPAEHERNVCGQLDENLKRIERSLKVSMIERDGGMKIMGEEADVQKAASVFKSLVELSKRGTQITEQNVSYAISLAFDEGEDQLLVIDRDLVCRTAAGRPVKPKTLGQKQYVDLIRQKMITFGIGPAGTGKTYLAMAMAIQAFRDGDAERIILTPPWRREKSWASCPGTCSRRSTPTCGPSTTPSTRSWGRRATCTTRRRG